MIRISHLSKSYGEQILFSDVNLNLGSREKIGLIGRNGSGKSTFLKMLLDQESPNVGEIEFSSNLSIRTLEQNLNFKEATILKQVCLALPKDAHNEDWKAKSILMGLGFVESDFERAPAEFSSGFQVRVRLAEALVSESELLLLDEPTNYLDILSLRWLERFLKEWKGSFILVTHDRRFMEEVVTHSIAIHRGRMRKMPGGPSKLMEQIQKDEEVYEKTRLNMEKKKAKTEEFIRKFRAGARSAGLVQSRIKALEKQDVGEKLGQIADITFHFRSKTIRGNSVLQAEGLCFGYKKHQTLIDNFSLTIHPKDRIAIIGRNGKGKSTLLKLLVEKLHPQSGSVSKRSDLNVGYFGADSIGELHLEQTIYEELMSLPQVSDQEVRAVCGSLLFQGEDTRKPISKISGGEKSRVCLGKVLLYPSELLALDEPTNHLDMESCRALTRALTEFSGTIIFVTHDEDMISKLATRLVIFDDNTIKVRNMSYPEFLQSEGWKEEESVPIKNTVNTSTNKLEYLERKELKQNLRKLQTQIKKAEQEIEKLDKEQAQNSVLLQDACIAKNAELIEKYGKQASLLAETIDQKYLGLEELMEEEANLESIT